MIEPSLVVEKHIIIQSTQENAVSVLAKVCPEISRQKLKLAMQYGAVWLTSHNQTKRLRRAKKSLNPGEELHLYYDSAKLFADQTPARLIADEGEYSVWDKPCGMFSQGTKWGDHYAVCRWIELNGFKLNAIPARPALLVHRLDRATRGLILVAHTKDAVVKLTQMFAARQITKRYLAKVKGAVKSLAEDQRITAPVDCKEASTLILKLKYLAEQNQTEILLQLETGRKHQIRRHLSQAGYPIMGDRLYTNITDSEQQIPPVDLQLFSCYLGFDYPSQGQWREYRLPASE